MCPLFVSRAALGHTSQNSSVTSRRSSSSSGLPTCSAPPPASIQPHLTCTYPSFFTFLGVLVLCTYPVQVELRHVVKLPLLLATAALHAWVNIAWLGELMDCVGSTVYLYQG